MRQTEEDAVWGSLQKSRASRAAEMVDVDGIEIDVSVPCLVIAGRNGTGKSRMLRSLLNNLNDKAVLVDLHALCEKALNVLRSRDDFKEMKDEYERFGPDLERRSDVERVVGREYVDIDWFALEIESTDPTLENRFRWLGDEEPSLIPYFEVSYRGINYTAQDMGLGEFSVHFLFWILEQYRDADDLTLLLDEPDAYLPPDASTALLARLQNICLKRRWSLVVSTHSPDVIESASNAESLAVLSIDEKGALSATHVTDVPTVADTLLSAPPVRFEVFVEDETAYYLARALFGKLGNRASQGISVVWSRGQGYMVKLQDHLPVPPRPAIGHICLFDGDQRSKVQRSNSRQWPALFLPTESDPDSLLKDAADSHALASRLGISADEITREIQAREGMDPHDWVNQLGDRFGRPRFLAAVAEVWVEHNPELTEEFIKELNQALKL